jgi:6-phosphofructokinase 1
VVAEGSKPRGGAESIIGASLPGQDRRLGGIAERLGFEIQKRTGKETRAMVLGHLQRGGSPTGYDRLLATRFGAAAVQAVAEKKWGQMVALQSPHLVTLSIEEVLRETKRVDPAHDVVQAARMMGISFGD